MRQKSTSSNPRSTEEHYFRRYLDEVSGPIEPVIKIYRIGQNGKQVCMDCLFVEEYDVSRKFFRFPQPDQIVDRIRNQFGPGKYLLRTVYSNGRFGPSRVVHIG